MANVAVLLAAGLFSVPIGHLDRLTPQQIAILTVAQDVTLGLLLVGLLGRWPRIPPAALGFAAPVAWRTGLGAGAALWGLSIVIANAQATVVGAHPQSLVLAAQSHRSLEGLLIDLAFGAGLVAVVEELFFRAVAFALLRQRLPFLAAAALSSALFAVVHELGAWLPVFALGLGLAYLYERRRSLWTNAVAHGMVNGLSFLILFLLPGFGG